MGAQSGLAATVWHLVLLTQLLGLVWSQRPAPPSHVHVDSRLRWSAPPGLSNLSYTVQFLSSVDEQWNNFPSCVQSQNTSCDVTANMKEADLGCVRLRVLAHGHNLTSDPEEACSQQGDPCSPEVLLSSRPGTLTVNLRGDHPLVHQHGSWVEHRVYFGREGEPLKAYRTSPSSVVIKELEEGRRYCVRVVLVYFGTPVGPPSCVKCQDVPRSEVRARLMAVTLGLVFLVAGVLVVLFLLYVLLFQRERIKELMRPPYEEANCINEPFPVQRAVTYNPNEEQWDLISLIVPRGDQEST